MQTKTLPYKYIKLNADTLTPIGIFENLYGRKKFLLESSIQHEEKGKYSFIGADPFQEFKGSDEETNIINHEQGTDKDRNEPVLTAFQNEIPKMDIEPPFPFFGGAVGYIGYDAIRSYANIGEALPDEIDMPDVHLMLYQNIIIYDHSDESVFLVATNLNNQPEHVLDQRLASLKKALIPFPTTDVTIDQDVFFHPEMDRERFMENVELAKENIKNGDIYQVVLSQRMKAEMHGDPFIFYRKLRKANPSPYMFYIDFDDYVVLGASPESLIETSSRNIMTNPIAGTRPRGNTKDEDEALRSELITDKKEISEHEMLVDLSRDDFARVCEPDSITVPAYMKVESYQHVMHIVSEVHGKLAEGYTSIDALIACLPAGTVSGSPRTRAMQLINELEDVKRGVYSGGVGYISFNYNLNIALAIRSLIVKDRQAYLQAGAGIVNDSNPEAEYNETMHKAKALMAVKDYEVSHEA
ncbi:anthranilate synthase component I [Lentibacillus amyloliquefaciens]|uniref:Anthranilate synthase component 1 n=1 Tax=Lentibacillus amyloliquefaciens TaxID=1472767 RepID=A0A0U4G8Z6_9BACI|nr:anthranilate synthase component I [Lentibacillus amyloliquefaciens]ALX49226.1 anthranilate synthase subunit I [Lentibacillus amyloliquefaciens]